MGRRSRWIQAFDTKRVITRFGVVDMPTHVEPDTITIEQMLTDRSLKLIPREELTEGVQKIVDKMAPEPLPNLRPKPVLTRAQVCMLEIVAELQLQGSCDWEAVLYHFGVINGLVPGVTEVAGKRVADALIRRRLLTEDGPLLTLQGRARVRAEETAELWRTRLGLYECPLERVERNPDPEYDEIYFIRADRLDCCFRHQCFEVRPRAKLVVFATYTPV